LIATIIIFYSGGLPMKLKYCFLVVILATSALFAQRCIVSGYVRDASTGEAIAGANVKVEGEPFGSAANIHGYYTITALPAGGPYSLAISAVGYSTVKRQIVCRGEHIRLDVELEPEAIVGEEVVIRARRVGGMMDPYVGHMVIKSDLIRHAPGLVEPDLFRTLQMLPGVNSISDYSSGLYIWGGSPSDNLVLLDNIEVYNPTHLMGFFSTFIVDAVREVNLVKGGYPAKWGGRLGSVLEVTNKDGNRREFHGNAELSLLSGKLFLEGPMHKGSWMVAGRRTWIDLATAMMERNGIMDEHIPYYFYDFQGKVNRDLSDRDKLSFSFYGGDDVFAIENDPPEPMDGDTLARDDEGDDFEYRWGNLTFSTQWTRIFNERLFGHFVLAGSMFRTKLSADGDEMELTDRIGDMTLKSDMSYAYTDKHFLTFGGMLKWREVKNYFRVTEFEEGVRAREFVSDKNTGASLIALYAQDEFSPNVLWKVQSGLRMEFATNGNYLRVGPRLSAQRLLDESTTLRMAYGRYYQYIHLVNPLEDMGIAVFDSWVPIDENIKPAVSDHFVVGIETDRFAPHISANAYFKRMDNLLESREEIDFDSEGNLRARFHVGKGWASGFDVAMEGKVGRFAGWAGYALGWTRRTMPELNNGKSYPPKYDRLHTLKLHLAYEPSERLTLSAGFNYGTGQPTTEPVGFEELSDPWYRYFYPIWDGSRHNARLPDYHRLDLGVNWVAHDGRWKLMPYLQILNIYNRKNVLYRQWDYPSVGDSDPDDSYMLPFLPSFGVRAEF